VNTLVTIMMMVVMERTSNYNAPPLPLYKHILTKCYGPDGKQDVGFILKTRRDETIYPHN